MIGTARPDGHLPARRLLVEGRDPRRAPTGSAGDGGYKLMLVMGLIGAFCTCAYMTRTIWYMFFGEPRGRGRARTPPHESGPRITVPLVILAGLAVIAGFANLPDTGVLSWVPESIALRFEHFVEPTARLLPGRGRRRRSDHPEFTLLDRARLDAGRRARRRRSPTSGTGRAWARTASPSATGSPAPATRCSRTSTTSTTSTPT